MPHELGSRWPLYIKFGSCCALSPDFGAALHSPIDLWEVSAHDNLWGWVRCVVVLFRRMRAGQL